MSEPTSAIGPARWNNMPVYIEGHSDDFDPKQHAWPDESPSLVPSGKTGMRVALPEYSGHASGQYLVVSVALTVLARRFVQVYGDLNKRQRVARKRAALRALAEAAAIIERGIPD